MTIFKKKSFDHKWENKIYKKKLHVNKYPFDQVVSLAHRFLDKKKIKINKEIALELGCGTGNNLMFLKNYGFSKVYGIDGSKTAVTMSKKFTNKPGIKISKSDFITIPFKNNFFKLCLDRGSITHNKKSDIIKILNEVNRCLKKNGFFFSFIFSKTDQLYKDKIKKRKKSIEQKLQTTFLSLSEVKNIYSLFDIIDLTHEVKINKIKKIKKAMWIIVAKKK